MSELDFVEARYLHIAKLNTVATHETITAVFQN